MRSSESILLRGLALASVADWLIGRTLTRGAVYMPKSPSMVVVFQLLGLVGQFAFTLTGLLALLAIGWLAWQMRREGRAALSFILIALLAISLLFVFVPTGDWGNVAYHLLVLGAMVLLGATARESRVWIFPGIALGLAQLYQTSAALSSALHLSELLPFTLLWFFLGEFFVVASGFAFWWISARGRARWWMWLIATLAALMFSGIYLVNPSITAMIAIWSMGLTLYLPMPLYAFSLLLTVLTMIVWLRENERAGWAIPLLAASGYAPQISTEVFLSIIALWLLTRVPLLKVETPPFSQSPLRNLAHNPSG